VASGDFAKPSGNHAQTLGNFAQTSGSFARTTGQPATASGTRAAAHGECTRTSGGSAGAPLFPNRTPAQCQPGSFYRALCRG